MSEWQPIETAPKDETMLLLWVRSLDGGACAIGHYYLDEWRDAALRLIEPFGTYRVTHWMPLPEPPDAP